MGNVADHPEYKVQRNARLPLFVPENYRGNSSRQIAEEYTLSISEYAGKVNQYNLRGSECVLSDGDRKIAEWKSIDNSSDFYQIISHSNRNRYLVFRQDLYGFSVFDFSSGEIRQYYPEESLQGKETFIWTDVNYNPVTDVLAVSGCYWACPYSTHLFTFADPMSERQRYVDMIEYFGGGYDRYDDVDFIRWEAGDMCISRFDVETETREELIIASKEYLDYLCNKGKEL